MSELPKGWIETPLMNFIHFLPTGVTPYTGEKEYYSTGSIQNSSYKSEGKFTFEDKPSRANRLAKIGDVFQARMKGTDKGLIINEKLNDKLFSTGFIQLRPIANTYNSKLLYYFVKSKIFTDQKDELATGSTQEALTDTSAKELKLLVPPLNEQKRIVEKLDKILANVDEAKERLEKIPVILKRFRQSVLNAAVTGELTKEWREKNQVTMKEWREILVALHKERIVKYQKSIELAKCNKLKKPLQPNYLNYDLNESIKIDEDLPSSWLRITIGFLCDCIVPGRDKPKSFSGEIPWITLPDINEDIITTNSSGLGLSVEEIKQVKSKIIPAESVIMSCIGRFGVTALAGREIVINQQLHAFLKSPMVISKYLMYHIRTLSTFMNDISTSTTISYLNKDNCNSLPINLPPLKEQYEIIKRVEALFNTADEIEERYKKAKAYVDKLTQSILTKAFRGELVLQDPNDEPAEKLLESVREEREKQISKTKNKNASKNKRRLKKKS